MKEREAFETWVTVDGMMDCDLTMVDGNYIHRDFKIMWKAWQARAQQEGEPARDETLADSLQALQEEAQQLVNLQSTKTTLSRKEQERLIEVYMELPKLLMENVPLIISALRGELIYSKADAEVLCEIAITATRAHPAPSVELTDAEKSADYKSGWNAAIKRDALIVCPIPHVEEERRCEEIAAQISSGVLL